MISIVELLKLRGLDTSKKIKFVRHKDQRQEVDVHELYRHNLLDIYQSYQSDPIFECDYIVSFLGLGGTQALFIGIYRVNGKKTAPKVPVTVSYNDKFFIVSDGGDILYDLEPVSGFEDLKDRVVIDWGKAALAWDQWLTDKAVIKIIPEGYINSFPGYLEVQIRHDELVKIIDNPEAHKDWHDKLSSVAGVYIILDTKTGKQYVGSAYGREGILGRWKEYAHQPSGGNKQLEELLASEPGYEKYFLYSILHTLSINLNKDEVIQFEVLFKRKLGARAFGLNLN